MNDTRATPARLGDAFRTAPVGRVQIAGIPRSRQERIAEARELHAEFIAGVVHRKRQDAFAVWQRQAVDPPWRTLALREIDEDDLALCGMDHIVSAGKAALRRCAGDLGLERPSITIRWLVPEGTHDRLARYHAKVWGRPAPWAIYDRYDDDGNEMRGWTGPDAPVIYVRIDGGVRKVEHTIAHELKHRQQYRRGGARTDPQTHELDEIEAKAYAWRLYPKE